MVTSISGRGWVLAAGCLAVLVVGLDFTLLPVALPTVLARLGASQVEQVWFALGYLLALAVAAVPARAVGDRFGRGRVLLGSLVLFGTGSAICGLAGSPGVFLSGRLLQGVAGTGITVMVRLVLITVFDQKQHLDVISLYRTASFVALPLGAVLGGWVLQEFWWGWVFLVSVPVMALAALASMIMAGAFYVLPQYFQNVQQSDPLGSGLRMLPLIAGTTVGSVVVSLVPRRLSAGIAGGLGFLLLAAGLGLGARAAPEAAFGFTALWTAFVGAGLSLVLAVSFRTAQTD